MPILNSANLSLKTSVSSISRITVKTLTMTGASICVRVIWFIVEHITYMRKVFILLNCLILWFFIFLLIFFPTAVRTIFVSSCNRIHRTSIFVISSENTFTIYLLVLELTLRILKTWHGSKAISSSISITLHEVLIPMKYVGIISRGISIVATRFIFGPIKVEQFESSFPLVIGSIKLCLTSGLGIKVMVNLVILFIFLKFSHKCRLLLNRIYKLFTLVRRNGSRSIRIIRQITIVPMSMLLVVMI